MTNATSQAETNALMVFLGRAHKPRESPISHPASTAASSVAHHENSTSDLARYPKALEETSSYAGAISTTKAANAAATTMFAV